MHVSRLYPAGVPNEVMRRIRSSAFGGIGRLDDMRSHAVDKSGNLIPISLSAAMIYEHGKPTATVAGSSRPCASAAARAPRAGSEEARAE